MNSWAKTDVAKGAVLLALAVAMPFVLPGKYATGQLTLFFIWALVAVQWNLVFGVSGIFSMAQLGVFGVGGYAAALLALYLGLPFGWAVLCACGVAGVFGLLIGCAAFRLRGPYVALLTLAISQALLVLVVTDTACYVQQGSSCLPFTGGARGLSQYGDFGFRELLPYSIAHLGNYFVALTALVFGMAFALWLLSTPIGLAFRALRDNPVLAAGRGVSRLRYQLIVFTASSAFTGLAGALYAGHVRVMGPNVLGLQTLLMVLAMLIVGGLGTKWGPLIGAAAVMALDELLREIPEWRGAILGSALVLATLLLPSGIAGLGRLAKAQPHPPPRGMPMPSKP